MERKPGAELSAVQEGWLVHLRSCASTGETMRGYAARKGLSEHALYQAAKELRRKGALPPVNRTRGKRVAKRTAEARPRFVEVKTAGAAPRESAAWRAHLPNGVVIEGSTGLVEAVEALSRL